MDKIISSITNILNIDDEILTKFLGYLHPMTVPKKTILIRPLITDENVYIIEKGIARSYVMINEKEVTSWFSKEGELIFSTNSFYGKTEGYENERVQILEDSLLYYIKISDLEELCFQHIEISNWLPLKWEKFSRNILNLFSKRIKSRASNNGICILMSFEINVSLFDILLFGY